jgi:hypothetical protein
VDEATKAALLDLLDDAVEAGWTGVARAASSSWASCGPGDGNNVARPAHSGIGPRAAARCTACSMTRVAEIVTLYHEWGEIDRSHRKLAYRGSYLERVWVRVPDVDAQLERARSHGARVLQEPTEYEYGERECTVEDLAGHRWQFTQTLRDVAPDEWGGELVDP